ncbi:MAG: EamA family transporter [Clostridia bacterium]|nr:EamA family transporter [Clostridia bacterium]
MYYGVIVISVLLFGVNFALNKQYQKRIGSGFFPTFFLATLSSSAGVIVLFPLNEFRFEFTLFAFLMAATATVNSLCLNFCSLKTLGKVNLSLYSLFMMLGGMVLPSVVGVLFFEEGMTWAKGICYAIIVISLMITVEKSDKKGGWIYYAGVFVLNGMSGVISKIYQAADYPKISSSGYSLLCATTTLVVAGTLALILFPSYRKKFRPSAAPFGFTSGVFNRVANLLLLIALAHVPASVQYPMVTGGVMIVSTVIAAFSANKPTKKQWIAVGLSFVGILLLVTIPI